MDCIIGMIIKQVGGLDSISLRPSTQHGYNRGGGGGSQYILVGVCRGTTPKRGS